MTSLTKRLVAVATALTVSVFVAAPAPVHGQTVEELQAQIQALLDQLAQLQAQLAELEGGEAVVAIEGVPADFSFENNLKQGDSGVEVKYLQIVLNSDPDTRLAESGVGSPGNETEFFGPLTKAAVVKFQEKYADEVLAPWGLTSGTGFVGSTTRAKLNSILSAGVVQEAPAEEAPAEEAPAEEAPAEEAPAEGPAKVELDPSTPAAASVALGAQDVIFLKLKFFGGAEGYTISKIVVTRGGVSADADLADVKIWHGATQLDSTQAIDTNTHKATFSGMSFEVPAGETKVLTVTGSIAASGTATVGDSVKLSIASASDIVADKTLEGDFPISGNAMTIAGISVGQLNVAVQTTPATTTLLSGSVDQAIASWKFTASTTEGFKITKIVVTHVGSATADDISNIKLKYLGAQLGETVAKLDSQNRAVFDLSSDPLEIKAGSSKTVTAYADIASGISTSRTVIFEITQYTDVTAYGTNSGGVTTVKATVGGTSFSTFAKQTGNTMTIGQGTLTVAVDSALNPAAQEYVKGTENRLFSAFKFTTGSREGVRVVKLRLKINDGTGSASDVSNVTLWDGSTLIAGPVGVVGAYATFGANTVGFDSVGLFDIPKSSNKTILVKANIPTGATTNKTVDFDIAAASDIWADGLDSKYDLPSDSITLSDGDANAHKIIASGSLSLSLSAQTPSAQTFVIGDTEKEFTRINLTAGSGEDIVVSGITLTIKSNGSNATSGAHLINVKLLKEDGSQYGSTVASPVATASFNESLTVPASQTVTLRAVADIPTSNYPDPNARIDIAATTDVEAVGASSGATITPSGTVTGNTMTISSGSLTVAVAATPGDQTRIIGDTEVPFVGLVLTAGTAEDVRVTRIKLTVNSSAGAKATSDVSNVALYDGVTRLTTKKAVTASTVEFIASDFLNSTGIDITKGQQKTITVKADLPSTGTANNTIAFGVSTTDDINTSGLFSNTDITETLTKGPGSGSTGANIDTSGAVQAANLFEVTLKAAGSITAAASADNPVTKVRAVGGEGAVLSGVEVLKVDFTASLEDIYIKQITIERASGGSDADVSAISLWDGLTQLGSSQTLSNASSTFNFPAGSYWVIPKGTTKTLTVKVDFNGIATANGYGAKPGDAPLFRLDSFDAEGVSSGNNSLTGEGVVDIAGNTQYLRKSKPTIASASLPSTTLITGQNVLYRWTVTADSAGDIGWRKIAFDISGTLGGKTLAGATTTEKSVIDGLYTLTSGTGVGWTKAIDNFKVWNVTDNQQVTGTSTDSAGTDITAAGAIIRWDTDAGAARVVFVPASEEVIAAGTSKTYELRGDIKVSPSSGDVVVTKISDLSSTATTTSYFDARRNPTTFTSEDVAIVHDSVNHDNHATTTVSFVWTDRSAPHLADSNVHSLSTLDWTNDYKVDGLPTASLSLSK